MIDGKNKKQRNDRLDFTRQYGATVEAIRRDHVLRYFFAADNIPKGSKVLDLACGCGYGSWILREAGLEVTGVDISSEAISYAENQYKGPTYLCQKAEDTKGKWDAIVTLETLEHLSTPEVVLNLEAPLVIASVPNEDCYPFDPQRFSGDDYPHLRHYRPQEFEILLRSCGLTVSEWYCQKSKDGDITKGTDGKFLLVIATR